jgi:hypothetical protein
LFYVNIKNRLLTVCYFNINNLTEGFRMFARTFFVIVLCGASFCLVGCKNSTDKSSAKDGSARVAIQLHWPTDLKPVGTKLAHDDSLNNGLIDTNHVGFVDIRIKVPRAPKAVSSLLFIDGLARDYKVFPKHSHAMVELRDSSVEATYKGRAHILKLVIDCQDYLNYVGQMNIVAFTNPARATEASQLELVKQVPERLIKAPKEKPITISLEKLPRSW